MNDPIGEAVEKILLLHDAVVERTADGLLRILAPATLAAHLGIPEEALLRFDPAMIEAPTADGSEGAYFVAYDSELLKRIAALLNGRGFCTERLVKGVYLKQGGVAAAAEQRFTILNGIGRARGFREQTISYLLFNCKFTAFSEERREGIVRCAVNEFSGNAVDDLITLLTWSNSEQAPNGLTTERKPLTSLYAALTKSARRSIEQELSHYHETLLRRLRRDLDRVGNYYASLASEIERKIERKSLTGKEREVELQRLEATHQELRKKVADQAERYSIEVKTEFLNAMRLYLNVLVVTFEVRRREHTRELDLIWNPLKKDFEEIACEYCGRDLSSFTLCDDRMHLVCVDCSVCRHCQKKSCRKCHPDRCPKCGKKQ